LKPKSQLSYYAPCQHSLDTPHSLPSHKISPVANTVPAETSRRVLPCCHFRCSTQALDIGRQHPRLPDSLGRVKPSCRDCVLHKQTRTARRVRFRCTASILTDMSLSSRCREHRKATGLLKTLNILLSIIIIYAASKAAKQPRQDYRRELSSLHQHSNPQCVTQPVSRPSRAILTCRTCIHTLHDWYVVLQEERNVSKGRIEE
jgi:ribosomal protein L37AE/L43A